ncbi:UxaA family hydrolase [Mucilaginibacter sp. UR6-11]|uniref:UxaA family hydrolase n=1 Tax=Mucilaginibacter sp. UR6-11 TaxID=1435644 RepID=UPI001E5E84A8|nr:altronate dehydratase family protein [Mucilaginibacter sp. UR6-11]MCC8426308.1 altronate dehydratase family protein [Mucilaginibacter sp. UR6-11]
MRARTLKIHPKDNIEVALSDLKAGEIIRSGDKSVTLLNDIAAKHKFALQDFNIGDEIVMYGVLVGKAMLPVKTGEIITTKNIKHASGDYQLGERKTNWLIPDTSAWKNRTFMGYHRADGSVGVANYWLVIPLVFCENRNVQVIQEAFVKELGYQNDVSAERDQVKQLIKLYRSGKKASDILAADLDIDAAVATEEEKIFPNVDGIKFLNHSLGCAGIKEDTRDLCGLLAGYITHANVAGATVLSLGCQNAQIDMLKDEIFKRDPGFSKPLYTLEQQQIGNESDLLKLAVKQTFAGLIQANELTRQPAPLSKLCVGLECGGSDGFSGISANPSLGHASDLIVELGGSVILAEFPELCGVEQELSDRCVDDETASRFIYLMRSYHDKAKALGSGFESNPSAGNVRDGLITDAIKSAGAAKKGGTSPVTDVLDYPEKVRKQGLTLLCTPGSDVESTTAEVGAGATIVIFTTGLGTPTGNPIAPVVKVSTSTKLYQKMTDIIDIDAGTVISGEESINEAGERILEQIIRIASGEEKAKAVTSGHDDFIPWKRGISL